MKADGMSFGSSAVFRCNSPTKIDVFFAASISFMRKLRLLLNINFLDDEVKEVLSGRRTQFKRAEGFLPCFINKTNTPKDNRQKEMSACKIGAFIDTSR